MNETMDAVTVLELYRNKDVVAKRTADTAFKELKVLQHLKTAGFKKYQCGLP